MFENIERFYEENHYVLIEDKSEGSLRPGKSFTKDVENCIGKFRDFYAASGNETINEERLVSIIGGVDTNTRSQNLRVMREFKFLVEFDPPEEDGAKYRLTAYFKKFVESEQKTDEFIMDRLRSISSVSDLSMYLNLLLCTLREAYLYGQVMLFKDSDDKFKQDVPDLEKRNAYRERIYKVYGYSGRDKKITDDVYSPNLSYMSRAELENLGLLIGTTQKIDGMNNLVLTTKGYELLCVIDSNLANHNEDEGDEEFDEYQKAAHFMTNYVSESGFEIPVKSSDIEATRQEFLSRFAPDKLSSLDDTNILSAMFYTTGDNTESLCYWLENNKELWNYFGKIGVGSSLSWGLFQDHESGEWTTGSPKKKVTLTVEQAIVKAKEIRDALVKAAACVEKANPVSVSDYEILAGEIANALGDELVNKSWIHKYLAVLHPDKFSCYHSDDWQKHILYCFGIVPHDNSYVRSGQIALIENYCHWYYRQFFAAHVERFGRPKTFLRIGTDGESGNFAELWQQDSIIGIGWPKLGALTDYAPKGKYDKDSVAEALEKMNYPGDKRTSSTKAGELERFFNAGEDTVFVAASGQHIISLIDSVGEYAYKIDEYPEMPHVRFGKWCRFFGEEATLPEKYDGLQTSCYQIKNEKNLLFLYKKYYFDDESTDLDFKEAFLKWMLEQKRLDKDGNEVARWGEGTAKSYISSINTISVDVDGNMISVWNCIPLAPLKASLVELEKRAESGYGDDHNKALNGMRAYVEFRCSISEEDMDEYIELKYETKILPEVDRNRIVFGAPGTGKSFKLKEQAEKLISGTQGAIERVTFHPDYTYSQFVGAYKPTMEGKDIRYEFVPGPFMRVYVEALKSGRTDNPQPFLLIIEEINRAKVAGVFGDIFQLLDRDDSGVSEYGIQASEDVKKYLADKLKGSPENYNIIKIPDNMFIWATMNSADQGVFPMDTAFKRRWSFEYLGIDAGEEKIQKIAKFDIAGSEEPIEWNRLRKAINKKMASTEFHINEDKLMGPFFLALKLLKSNPETGMLEEPDKFLKVFKSKVLMYLYEDAVKQRKHDFFDNCDTSKYSAVCDAFDTIGLGIFGSSFVTDYYNKE